MKRGKENGGKRRERGEPARAGGGEGKRRGE